MKKLIVCIISAVLTLIVLGLSSQATKAPTNSNYFPVCSFSESNTIDCN